MFLYPLKLLIQWHVVEKECFTRPLSFKYTFTEIHSLHSIQLLQPHYGMPWAYQLLLCNYRTLTAGPSCRCQRVSARCHLSVKGFLFERKAHCVSAQVMRRIHEQQHKSLCRFYPNTLQVCRLQPAPHKWELCRCMTHFSFPCICETISIVFAVKTIAPLKISRVIGLIQYSRLKVLASLEQRFLIIIGPRGV